MVSEKCNNYLFFMFNFSQEREEIQRKGSVIEWVSLWWPWRFQVWRSCRHGTLQNQLGWWNGRWQVKHCLIFVHSITLITFFVFFVEAIYKEKLLLPTAPRAARGSDIDESRIPNNAPYTAYIANLPYDIEVEDVSKFFHGLTVRLIT